MRENLIKFRGARNQQAMAERYGVTQQAWSAWEQGYSFPRLSILEKLSFDSGLTIEQLLFNSENTTSSGRKEA